MTRATECFCTAVSREPLAGTAHDAQGGFVTDPGRIAPCEQAVPLQHRAGKLRVGARQFAEPQSQIKSRALPRQPADLHAENGLREFAAAPCAGDRDHRIRMHMIHMRVRDEGMQRGVDAGCARVQRKGAMRQVADHLVLVREVAVERFQLFEFLQIERGKSIELHAGEITPGALDPQHRDLRATQRIVARQLGRGIACLLYTSPSPRDRTRSRMPSSA